MENTKPTFSELFEQTVIFPDPDMHDRFNLLVGLDETKETLKKILGLLINPDGIAEWAKKFHPDANLILNFVTRRPPLIVLAGDVGSGKSELAYTIGDAVARQENIDVELFPLSLSTRGQGRVGQMTQLISSAFEYTLDRAKKLKSASGKSRGAVILLVDEADALAQSRENDQMHHEDKAGVNAFIRGIDGLGNGKYPAAVIMCTNRPNSLDPAIRRRAAEIVYFTRPSAENRNLVLAGPLGELGFKGSEIQKIVEMTGPLKDRDYGFTFSDLVQRLLPSLVPTAPFKES